MPSQEVLNWLRTRFFPHIWCPGCGHGIIMHALLRALVDLGKKKEETVIASGIGCSSRMPGYIDACTLHTTHGRSLAFATGVKLANPELTVIDVMGDGDCTAIGGNHFIHACRRNIDITAIVMNNNIYGMTGGRLLRRRRSAHTRLPLPMESWTFPSIFANLLQERELVTWQEPRLRTRC